MSGDFGFHVCQVIGVAYNQQMGISDLLSLGEQVWISCEDSLVEFPNTQDLFRYVYFKSLLSHKSNKFLSINPRFAQLRKLILRTKMNHHPMAHPVESLE